ncbi:MAG TPA: cation transporter [Acidimicrobiia bacterium]|nr:cation transporter [Acidimicrobiia bacterium]
MNQTTLSVPDIHCNHCKMSLEGALGQVAGVKQATVDVPTATIAVTYDAPATEADLVAAVEGQGYEVKQG